MRALGAVSVSVLRTVLDYRSIADMSRVARIVVPGFPHHVVQRGNRRADIFYSDDDRLAYTRFLKKYAAEHGLKIWAYCLMTNHLHLVAVPERERSLGLALHDAHSVYALYFNSRYKLSGHLWQGRFYSCPMDETHAWAAVRYVECNPVRAGMVACAQEYPWSSAGNHCGLRTDTLLAGEFPPPDVIEDWPARLHEGEPEDMLLRLRRQTHTGRPFGSPQFLAGVETILGRGLRPKKPGRKSTHAKT